MYERIQLMGWTQEARGKREGVHVDGRAEPMRVKEVTNTSVARLIGDGCNQSSRESHSERVQPMDMNETLGESGSKNADRDTQRERSHQMGENHHPRAYSLG